MQSTAISPLFSINSDMQEPYLESVALMMGAD